MSNLISLTNVSLAYGLDPLLDQVNLQIMSSERVCLIGRNGVGKSSLFKIIEGTLLPDGGSVWRQPNLRLARLQQELPQSIQKSVYEFVAEGLEKAGKLLAAYHALTHKLTYSHSTADLNALEQLQQQIEAIHAWHFEQEIKTILLQLGLDPELKITELSGGWQRRAALARALVAKPELLLLDEPTNHLDIDAIKWLEDYLLGCRVGLLFITHDRSLLQRLATRIIELDRGQLSSWPGDYQNFIKHKAELLYAEEKQNALFDKRLAEEEKWIRQGIKARRTRNEGRVRALEAMRRERSQRREIENKVTFNVHNADKSGQLVIEAKNISYQYHKPIVKDFSLRVMRGDRIGLIGPNGVGKSTLLNLLLGKLEPQQGKVILGTKLTIAYFDQLRATLDFEKTIIDNVVQGSDTIEVNGQKRHIISYLGDFLFTPNRALTKVSALSGGECNRLVLARLFSQSANLLVMDEPTNDLDLETLELLEEILSQYQGTLLLVSHDRKFLDQVVTSSLVFEGEGKIKEYIGGYEDWLRQKKSGPITKPLSEKENTQKTVKVKTKENKKLSFKEQEELKSLPSKIETLERTLAEQQQALANPQFYTQSPEMIVTAMEKLKNINSDLDLAYRRWEELEAKAERAG